MRRYNERLYRAARAITRDEREAEDVMQQAYVNAFSNLWHFKGHAQFATWLTRIAVNEALARVRRRARYEPIDDDLPNVEPFMRDVEGLSTAETAASLCVSEEAVKTRLSRARAALRRSLLQRAGATASEAFRFQRPGATVSLRTSSSGALRPLAYVVQTVSDRPDLRRLLHVASRRRPLLCRLRRTGQVVCRVHEGDV